MNREVRLLPDRTRSASFDGFGASLAWWANEFGAGPRADALAELAFGREPTPWDGANLPGLGLAVARYNVGGGPPVKRSEKLPDFKDIEGFWPTEAKVWDGARDPGQRALLKKALAYGVRKVELFSNSPPAWMCRNRSTAGSDDGKDNLAPERYDDFARYLATVTRHAIDDWKAPVHTIAPFNEPSAWWWKFPGGQEGCPFSRPAQAAVLPLLRRHLDSLGLRRIRISSSDENDVDTALTTWKALGPDAQKAVAQVNAHAYYGLQAYRGAGRAPLRDAVRAAGKRLWMSEYGDDDASGATLAETIARDLAELEPDAWIYWQPFDSGGWGLIQSNPGDHWIGPVNRKYFVLAQYSRHLRPGMRLLGGDDPRTAAGHDPKRRTLALVTYAPGPAQTLVYDLSGFARVAGPVRRWTTQTSGADAYRPGGNAVLEGRRLSVPVPADSVVTLEIEGVG